MDKGIRESIWDHIYKIYGPGGKLEGEIITINHVRRKQGNRMNSIASGTFSSSFNYFMAKKMLVRVAKGLYKIADGIPKEVEVEPVEKKEISLKTNVLPLYVRVFDFLKKSKETCKLPSIFEFNHDFVQDSFPTYTVSSTKAAIQTLTRKDWIYRKRIGIYGVSEVVPEFWFKKRDPATLEMKYIPPDPDPITRATNALNEFIDAFELLMEYTESLEAKNAKLSELQEPLVKELEKATQLIRQRKFINVNLCEEVKI